MDRHVGIVCWSVVIRHAVEPGVCRRLLLKCWVVMNRCRWLTVYILWVVIMNWLVSAWPAKYTKQIWYRSLSVKGTDRVLSLLKPKLCFHNCPI